MSLSRKLIIQDACVIFDLLDLSLLDLFFDLGHQIITTRAVINEINGPEQISTIENHISKRNLIVDISGKIEHIGDLSKEHSSLSFADCSVLELALRRNGLILSSDGSLRKVSRAKGLEVRGTLWVVDLLITHGRITNEFAIQKLNYYPKVNKRAPRKLVEEMLVNLKSRL